MYQSDVRRFLLKMTKGDHAFADDMAQDTFVKAFANITSYRREAAFSSWLYSIAYRVFLDNVKRDNRRQHLLEAHASGSENTTKSASSRSLEAEFDIEKALATLKVAEKTAIVLCLQEGFSHTDAALIMALPIGTVKSHIARGREVLKQQLRVWQKHLQEEQ